MSQRELSPRPQEANTEDMDGERMASATDSSQSDVDTSTRDKSETANDVFEDGQDGVKSTVLFRLVANKNQVKFSFN